MARLIQDLSGRVRVRRVGALLMLFVLALTQGGCVSAILSNLAVKAPNQQRVPRAARDPEFAARHDRTYAHTWRVPVGPPAAELAVAVLEPGDYGLKHAVTLQTSASGARRFVPRTEWQRPAEFADAAKIKGTVLVLHGYMDARENIMHWGLALAQQGFRAVMVDLRGHGRSTGNVISFGGFEARDLSQVIDDLERRGLVAGRVGALGISYGASTGLLLARRDPRVATVVALEPYSNAAEAVVEFAHGVAPARAGKISPATFAAAVARAPVLGGFSWADADVLAAVKELKVPVLFFHGAKDRWLSPDHSRRMFEVAPRGSHLEILPDDDHVRLSMRLGGIAPQVNAWFTEQLQVRDTAVIAAAPPAASSADGTAVELPR